MQTKNWNSKLQKNTREAVELEGQRTFLSLPFGRPTRETEERNYVQTGKKKGGEQYQKLRLNLMQCLSPQCSGHASVTLKIRFGHISQGFGWVGEC